MSEQPREALPRWKCHKEVEAVKIVSIIGDMIIPEMGDAPFEVSREYIAKHAPEVGGYYVRYADGYESYSPASAFEEGYTRIVKAPGYVERIPANTSGQNGHVGDWKGRVRIEKAELDLKRDKLTEFLKAETFSRLPRDARERLLYQAKTMERYSEILAERIAHFD